jgi:SH3 domain protein
MRLILLLLLTFEIFARVVYITDEVDIPIRSEKSFEDNIVRSAPSGTKLEILQTDNDGWTKIKLEQTKGWIISRYLSNNPPARDELERLQKQYDKDKITLTKQRQEITTLKTELKDLKLKNKTNKTNALKAISEKKHIEKTYTDALKIEHENIKLKAENLNLRSELKLSEISNELRIEDANRSWFLYGGILVFISLTFGFIFAKIARKQ